MKIKYDKESNHLINSDNPNEWLLNLSDGRYVSDKDGTTYYFNLVEVEEDKYIHSPKDEVYTLEELNIKQEGIIL